MREHYVQSMVLLDLSPLVPRILLINMPVPSFP